MSLHILFLIFGNYFGSFRDTWISDDFGIFRNVFRILDLNLGICLFIFKSKRKISSFIISFPFSFFLISFLPPQPQVFSIFPKFQIFSKITTSTHFHQLPPTSSFNASLSLSLPWPAKWPREGTTHPPLFAQNPLSITLFTPPLQNQNPI